MCRSGRYWNSSFVAFLRNIHEVETMEIYFPVTKNKRAVNGRMLDSCEASLRFLPWIYYTGTLRDNQSLIE